MQKKKRIVIAGSAADPVTRAHRDLAELLTHATYFDEVLWVPTGERRDKMNLLNATHRVRMTELAFSDSWKKEQPVPFRFDLRDAFRENTPTIYLLEELQRENPGCEIVFATGVDVLLPRPHLGGKCEVMMWEEGERLMRDFVFAVVPREGYTHPQILQSQGQIPKHFLILDSLPNEELRISSTEVRKRARSGLSISDLVHPEVAEYIKVHGLYLNAS